MSYYIANVFMPLYKHNNTKRVPARVLQIFKHPVSIENTGCFMAEKEGFEPSKRF
jgi:hypothetical protein